MQEDKLANIGEDGSGGGHFGAAFPFHYPCLFKDSVWRSGGQDLSSELAGGHARLHWNPMLSNLHAKSSLSHAVNLSKNYMNYHNFDSGYVQI